MWINVALLLLLSLRSCTAQPPRPDTKAPTSAPTVSTKAPTSAPTVSTKAPTSAPTVSTKAPTSAPTSVTGAPTSTGGTWAPTQSNGPCRCKALWDSSADYQTDYPACVNVVGCQADMCDECERSWCIVSNSPCDEEEINETTFERLEYFYCTITSAPTVTTKAPTSAPTSAPTVSTKAPTSAPTVSTKAPTSAPTVRTKAPTSAPTVSTKAPTSAPTVSTKAPTASPTASPTSNPTKTPLPQLRIFLEGRTMNENDKTLACGNAEKVTAQELGVDESRVHCVIKEQVFQRRAIEDYYLDIVVDDLEQVPDTVSLDNIKNDVVTKNAGDGMLFDLTYLIKPTWSPTASPTAVPTLAPTKAPTSRAPSVNGATFAPTNFPTAAPSTSPTASTKAPTANTKAPTASTKTAEKKGWYLRFWVILVWFRRFFDYYGFF